MEKFILSQGDVKDAAGRRFLKPMSAYEYAYWACDTRMRHMMKKYMDAGTKAIAHEQCKAIKENGVDFTLNGEGITNSKHFDYNPLLLAYENYIAQIKYMKNARQCSNPYRMKAQELWLNIGKEFAKVPIHVAQEVCSSQNFFPLYRYQEWLGLQNPDDKRTIIFYNFISSHNESWFSESGPHRDLGVSFSMVKMDARVGQPSCGGQPWLWQLDAEPVEPQAITAQCQARADKDLKQTLLDLKPTAPSPGLTP